MSETLLPVNEPSLIELKGLVEDYVEGVLAKGYDGVNDDLEHYIFEAAVMTFYGPKVFDTLNKVSRDRS